ncbi:MAG: FAD-binding oxidoreductase [bacterium]
MKRITDVMPPDRVSTSPETLLCYGFDASGTQSLPSAVVWPENVDDIVNISRFASENSVPICPRGAGTGMTGGATPLRNAVVVSFERMNRILEIDADNLTVIVEPGVINGNLQRELLPLGLFYPPDPASMNFCTIGGNVAENAGGPRAVKYGVTRDYVLEIEGVLPDGRMITTGVRTAKGVVGYDLTRLLVGSEGTLCTMSKIRLKLLPLPQDVVTLLAVFGDLGNCGTAVTRIISSKIIPRTLELMDRETIRAIEQYKPTGFPAGSEAVLLIELDGHPRAIAEEAEKTADICATLGADVRSAASDQEREKLWEARRAISPALYHLRPGKISEDIVVPRTRIPDMLTGLRSLSDRSGIPIVCFGHAGDGNIHVNLMIDRHDPGEMTKAHDLIKEIFALTLGFGGTISGEHGVGITKMEYIGMEIKEPAFDLMKGIKKLFDPKNILNPGKIFPE